MSRLSSTLVILGLLSFASAALAQEQQSSYLSSPCIGESLARPTLKRRLPTPDNPSVASVAGETVETTKPCEPRQTDSNDTPQTVRISFEGLKSMSESDLRKRFREQRVKLPKDPTMEPELVQKAEEEIKEFLTERGYMHPTVYTRIEKSEGTSNSLAFVVNEGPRFGISEFRFEGNRIFSSELLASMLRKLMTGYDEMGHQGYDADTLSYALHSLQNFVRSRGYLQANFSEPKIAEVGSGLMITVHADEGVLFRLGKIDIEGAGMISPQRIRAMLDLHTGDVANGARVSRWLFNELKEAYGELGFIQYTSEVEPEFHVQPDRAEGVVDLKITVDEGRRFKFSTISFAGVEGAEMQLQPLLRIRPGEIYNQHLFEDSIKKVNEAGLFEFVDKDKDVDFRTNEEEGLVNISIKITAKATPDPGIVRPAREPLAATVLSPRR